jgi:hypothetical protein
MKHDPDPGGGHSLGATLLHTLAGAAIAAEHLLNTAREPRQTQYAVLAFTGMRSGEIAPGQNLNNAGARKPSGSQVLAVALPTSPGSFQAEGTGLEPATPYGAPHFQCGR